MRLFKRSIFVILSPESFSQGEESLADQLKYQLMFMGMRYFVVSLLCMTFIRL